MSDAVAGRRHRPCARRGPGGGPSFPPWTIRVRSDTPARWATCLRGHM